MPALGRVLLHQSVAGVGHIQVALRVDLEPRRLAEGVAVVVLSSLAQVAGCGAAGVEAEHPVVGCVGYEHRAVGSEADAGGPRLGVPGVGGEVHAAPDLAGGGQGVYHAGIGVGHPQQAVVEHHVLRPVEQEGAFPGLAEDGAGLAVLGNHHDTVVAGVEHVDAVAGDGDRRRLYPRRSAHARGTGRGLLHVDREHGSRGSRFLAPEEEVPNAPRHQCHRQQRQRGDSNAASVGSHCVHGLDLDTQSRLLTSRGGSRREEAGDLSGFLLFPLTGAGWPPRRRAGIAESVR